MTKSEAQKEAEARYRKKCKVLNVRLYPGKDADIIRHIGTMPTYSRYIKNLIRKDM